MTRAGALRRWLRSVPSGICPGCSLPLPEGSTRRKRICRRPECPGRKTYAQLYGQDRRGRSRLKDVVSVEDVAGRPGRVLVGLSCGHGLELPRSKAARGKRAHCRTCPKGRRRKRPPV